MMRIVILSAVGVSLLWLVGSAQGPAAVPSIAEQAPNTWVKRSPLPNGPPSPRLGYESSWGYDARFGKLIRWGGHDPGGGGPQLTETWTYDVATGQWALMQTNNNPPGNCCCRENLVSPLDGKFYRFSYPAFGHGWFWDRSRFLREDSVWTYDLATNTWTNMRPSRGPAINVGKPAVWDPNRQIIWVYDTRLRAYDPYTNTWHVVNEGTVVTGSDRPVGKRTYAGMALDPQRNKIVLFGDHYQSDPRTLVYDIAKDEWLDMKPFNGPTSAKATPTMVYDSVHKVMICTMQSPIDESAKPQEGGIARRMETWTYDIANNRWLKMNPPTEPDNGGNRDKLMAFIPEMNIVVMETRTRNEQQIWTYRWWHEDPPREKKETWAWQLPRRPLSVATTDDGKAVLTWEAPPFEQQYDLIVRWEGDAPWRTTEQRIFRTMPVRGADPRNTTFTDSGLKRGVVYHYLVDTHGARTVLARTQPRLIVDSRVDVQARDKVVYSWAKSPEPDVVGYVVERAVLAPISGAQKVSYVNQYKNPLPLEAMVEKRGLGEWVRLTPEPIAQTSFTDTVDLSIPVQVEQFSWQPYFGAAPESGQNKAYDMTRPGCPLTIYAYRVRAVNRLGVEGGPSPYQMTVPNEVEDLLCREADDGKSASIKWDASPHAAIRGYLVYRLNGRGFQWDKDSFVELLTPEPIRQTTFTDATRPGKPCRYYVVVVDALGQQGLASHGAWGFRNPYGAHYARWYPADGWHQ